MVRPTRMTRFGHCPSSELGPARQAPRLSRCHGKAEPSHRCPARWWSHDHVRYPEPRAGHRRHRFQHLGAPDGHDADCRDRMQLGADPVPGDRLREGGRSALLEVGNVRYTKNVPAYSRPCRPTPRLHGENGPDYRDNAQSLQWRYRLAENCHCEQDADHGLQVADHGRPHRTE